MDSWTSNWLHWFCFFFTRMPTFLGKCGELQLRFFWWNTGRLDWQTSFFFSLETLRWFRASWDSWPDHFSSSVSARRDFRDKSICWKENKDLRWEDFSKSTLTSGKGGRKIQLILRGWLLRGSVYLDNPAVLSNFENTTWSCLRKRLNYFTEGIDFIVTALNFDRQGWLTDVNFFRDCELRDGETSTTAKEWCDLWQSTLDCLHVGPRALVCFLARPNTFSCAKAWHFDERSTSGFISFSVWWSAHFDSKACLHSTGDLRVWPDLWSGKLHSKATSRALPAAWSLWNTSQDLLVDSYPSTLL